MWYIHEKDVCMGESTIWSNRAYYLFASLLCISWARKMLFAVKKQDAREN